MQKNVAASAHAQAQALVLLPIAKAHAYTNRYR